MALKKKITLTGGVDVTNAYHRISNVVFNILTQTIVVDITVYKNQTTRDADEQNYIKNATQKVFISGDGFTDFFTTERVAQPLTDSIYSALYGWLKSNQALYIDATDI